MGEMAKGPLTVSDIICLHSTGFALLPFGPATSRVAYKRRQKMPASFVKNERGIPDTIMRMHWDDDWARYLADSMKLMKTDLRVPPLFGPSDVASFDKPVLVIGAEQDASFPGAALVARAKELFPHAETELLPGAKHGPSTTPEARAALADRVSRFIDGPS